MPATNDDRIMWADDAVAAFSNACHMEDEDAGTILGDLICDLMHWAADLGIDFDKALQNGRGHYECESDPDYEGD